MSKSNQSEINLIDNQFHINSMPHYSWNLIQSFQNLD